MNISFEGLRNIINEYKVGRAHEWWINEYKIGRTESDEWMNWLIDILHALSPHSIIYMIMMVSVIYHTLSIYLTVYLSIYLTIYLSIYLSRVYNVIREG